MKRKCVWKKKNHLSPLTWTRIRERCTGVTHSSLHFFWVKSYPSCQCRGCSLDLQMLFLMLPAWSVGERFGRSSLNAYWGIPVRRAQVMTAVQPAAAQTCRPLATSLRRRDVGISLMNRGAVMLLTSHRDARQRQRWRRRHHLTGRSATETGRREALI